jgi:FkbM family methyltransferase
MGSMTPRKSPFVNGARNVLKLLARITETTHLRYSVGDLASVLSAMGLPKRKNEARLAGFDVRFLDAASFRIVAYEIFLKGEYFFHAQNDSPVIFDCGANIGLATLFFKRLYPKAVVHAFEADPSTADILSQNVKRNALQNVTVHNVLLSDHVGAVKFFLPEGTPGSLMMSAFSSRLVPEASEISVNSARLSEYIDGPIDLLKLDVEGSEFVVMNDLIASGKISQIEQMMIEYHHLMGNEHSRFGGFLRQLEDAGFEYQIDGSFDRTAANGQFQGFLIKAYRA